MPLNIKDAETDKLARELAKVTGESITTAVKTAIVHRLAIARTKRRPLSERIKGIQQRLRQAPRLTEKSDDEILGYNEFGVAE